MNTEKTIGFIGAGNMGGALLKGYAPEAAKKGRRIFVYDKKEEVCAGLEQTLTAVTACSSEAELAQNSDILFLGVKPNLFSDLLLQITEHCRENSVIVSGSGYL